MNQILVTQKLYITPELKRKKKMYKFHFIISIFLVCILTSFYIYAEYDRNRGEVESKEILEGITSQVSAIATEEDDTIANDDILLVVLDRTEEDYEVGENIPNIDELNAQAKMITTSSGYKCKTVAIVDIPKIGVNYGVVEGETGSLEEIEALLKSSPVKYHGNNPNEVGNFCIVGHNYRNSKFFSKVKNLVVGDIVKLTDLSGRTITYEAYDIHTVDPNDTRDTTQMTGGRKELTLITCTDDSQLRIIVRCKEVKK